MARFDGPRASLAAIGIKGILGAFTAARSRVAIHVLVHLNIPHYVRIVFVKTYLYQLNYQQYALNKNGCLLLDPPTDHESDPCALKVYYDSILAHSQI